MILIKYEESTFDILFIAHRCEQKPSSGRPNDGSEIPHCSLNPIELNENTFRLIYYEHSGMVIFLVCFIRYIQH